MQRWDVFVSYTHEDEAWVRALADNLHRAGRDVFFDRWEVVGRNRLSQRLQQRLESSQVVVEERFHVLHISCHSGPGRWCWKAIPARQTW